MSFNQSMATITVDDVVYDVEEHSVPYGTRYTISREDEEMFEGLEGRCEMEQHDAEHDNPRDWCNVGTMAVTHDHYKLGGSDDEDISEIDFSKPCPTCNAEPINWTVGIHSSATALVVGSEEDCKAWLEQQADKETGRYYIEPICGEPGYVKWDGDPGHSQYEDGTMICPDCGGEGTVPESPGDYFKREHGARVVLPLSVYEHSGITMFVGHEDYVFDPGGWDTSYVGFIFDTPEQVKQCIGDNATDEQIKEALTGEVKVYASYLEGDVTWYSVQDDETNFHEACGGFVGCHDECERQMYEDLEEAIIKRIAEDEERLYWLQREVVTV